MFPSRNACIGYEVDLAIINEIGAHGSTASRDMKIAEELMVTCVDMYACSASGLAAEVYFPPLLT